MMSLEVGEYIPGYEGKYSVTKDGRVYSHLRGRFLNPSPDNKGYLRVTLCSDGIQKTLKVHRLVAQLFIPNPYCKPEVNHINGDKSDNAIWNLECGKPGRKTQLQHSEHSSGNGVKLPGVRQASLPRCWQKTSHAGMVSSSDSTGCYHRAT